MLRCRSIQGSILYFDVHEKLSGTWFENLSVPIERFRDWVDRCNAAQIEFEEE